MKTAGFNTSHVVVYQELDQAETMEDVGFNTSHVVVYLNSRQSQTA